MRQRGLNRSRENPELRDVYHDEQNEPCLGHSRSSLARRFVTWLSFDLIALHFFALSQIGPSLLPASLATAHTSPSDRISSLIGSSGLGGGP